MPEQRLSIDDDVHRGTLQRQLERVVDRVGHREAERAVDHPSVGGAVPEHDEVGDDVDHHVLEVGCAVVVEDDAESARAGAHRGVEFEVGVVGNLTTEVGERHAGPSGCYAVVTLEVHGPGADLRHQPIRHSVAEVLVAIERQIRRQDADLDIVEPTA